jgi:uncharacterized protein YndB with AHSA1/START domain
MTSDANTEPRILGTLRTENGKGVVRMEVRFDAEINDVWSALTEPEHLAHWLGTVDGDLRVGGEFHRFFMSSGSEGSGRVDACEPPRRFVVTLDPGTEGVQVVDVRLTVDGDQTVFTLEESGMPAHLLVAYGAGIQIHVEDLGAHLAGRDRCDADKRWAELESAYAPLAPAAEG